jgi:SAM-dependent methyltransferase
VRVADPVLESVAAYSEDADGYAAMYASKRLDQAMRFAASLPTSSRILDAGCGPGRDLARFVAQGHLPYGVDLNATFVAKANTYAPSSLVDLREVERHFDARSFDGVWADAALVHLNEAETAAVIRQFARLLREGGKLYASVRCIGETGWLNEPDGRRWYQVWDPSQFADVVSSAGFNVDQIVPGPYMEFWSTRRPDRFVAHD